MKSNYTFRLAIYPILCSVMMLFLGCENDPKDFKEATYPTNPEVFIDGFTPGLIYAAFSNTDVKAFQVDNKVTFNNSRAAMRIDVPNLNDPNGAYAGGAFFLSVGRDLSGYDALTFWAKSTKAASLDEVGFGLDFGANKYKASVTALSLSTTWKKYIIPIPDASKLKTEKGMFYFSEIQEGGAGYSFWIDDLKFEKLGTIAHEQGSILKGVDKIETSFNGVQSAISDFVAVFNLPNGINQLVNISPAYLNFFTSNADIATVNEQGVVSTIAPGSAVITATLAGQPVTGSLTLNAAGIFSHAPTPTRDANQVISIFSDHYANVPVDYYNGYYAPYQTTQSADFAVTGDKVLNYTNFNFVGIQFSAPTIDATLMSHLHIDLYFPNALPTGADFKFEVVDWGADGLFFGPDGVTAGPDNKTGTRTYTSPTLVSQNWVSLDIPLSSLSGLTSRAHLGQIIMSTSLTTKPTFYADNIYLYNDGSIIPSLPTAAAPTPTVPATDVISVFSNAYTNVAGTDFNPSWGQSTIATQVSIAGDNTLKYAGLNYQGIALGSNQNVSSKNFLHLDYYTANSTSLKVYLISPGTPAVEKSVVLTVPSSGVNGWKSIDIPLSSFSPVNLSNIFQMKFDGNGDIYLDNIYFRN